MLKPDLAILSLSATTGEGFTTWLDYLQGLPAPLIPSCPE